LEGDVNMAITMKKEVAILKAEDVVIRPFIRGLGDKL
jgi:hypothetical protein